MKKRAMVDSPRQSTEPKNGQQEQKGGRPRCEVSAERVQDLRNGGASWREIARALGIGKTTAMRLCDAKYSAGPKVSDNLDDKELGAATPAVPEAIPAVSVEGIADIGNHQQANGEQSTALDGKPSGPCAICGQNWWRKRGDGSWICAVCRPLPMPR